MCSMLYVITGENPSDAMLLILKWVMVIMENNQGDGAGGAGAGGGGSVSDGEHEVAQTFNAIKLGGGGLSPLSDAYRRRKPAGANGGKSGDVDGVEVASKRPAGLDVLDRGLVENGVR